MELTEATVRQQWVRVAAHAMLKRRAEERTSAAVYDIQLGLNAANADGAVHIVVVPGQRIKRKLQKAKSFFT